MEELILFTHDAFDGQGVPPSPGPIYIHAAACDPFHGDGLLPDEYRGQPITLEAFGAERLRVAEKRVSGTEGDAVLQGLFQDRVVDYVHVRSTTAGCYLFRVERLNAD